MFVFKSPRSGTANLFANGCKCIYIVNIIICQILTESVRCTGKFLEFDITKIDKNSLDRKFYRGKIFSSCHNCLQRQASSMEKMLQGASWTQVLNVAPGRIFLMHVTWASISMICSPSKIIGWTFQESVSFFVETTGRICLALE